MGCCGWAVVSDTHTHTRSHTHTHAHTHTHTHTHTHLTNSLHTHIQAHTSYPFTPCTHYLDTHTFLQCSLSITSASHQHLQKISAFLWKTLKVQSTTVFPYTFCQIQQIAPHSPQAASVCAKKKNSSVPRQSWTSKWQSNKVAQTEP